jgi:hypothetical protein
VKNLLRGQGDARPSRVHLGPASTLAEGLHECGAEHVGSGDLALDVVGIIVGQGRVLCADLDGRARRVSLGETRPREHRVAVARHPLLELLKVEVLILERVDRLVSDRRVAHLGRKIAGNVHRPVERLVHAGDRLADRVIGELLVCRIEPHHADHLEKRVLVLDLGPRYDSRHVRAEPLHDVSTRQARLCYAAQHGELPGVCHTTQHRADGWSAGVGLCLEIVPRIHARRRWVWHLCSARADDREHPHDRPHRRVAPSASARSPAMAFA